MTIRRYGFPVLWLGLSPLGYQVYLWVQSGAWPAYSLLHLWHDFGFAAPYFSFELFQRLVSLVLRVELGVLLTFAGLAMMVLPVVAEAVNQYRGEQLIKRSRRDFRPGNDTDWARVDFRQAS